METFTRLGMLGTQDIRGGSRISGKGVCMWMHDFWKEGSYVDPGFLERGFACIKVWGELALLILSHFS